MIDRGGTHRIRWSLVAFAILIVSLGLVFNEASQLGCPDIPREGNLSVIEQYARADGACTVPDLSPAFAVIDVAASTDLRDGESFVKDYSYVHLDAHSQSSGMCDVYTTDGHGGCDHTGTQVRSIAAIRIEHGLPSGTSARYNFFPVDANGSLDGTAQDVDTRLPQTTVLDSKKELFGGIGKHLLRY